MILNWKYALCILWVFLFAESQLTSAQGAEVSSSPPPSFLPPEQYAYIKDQLAMIEREGKINRSDPPFFEIISKNKRRIYVLGCIHNRHPELLLPQVVWHFLKNLEDQKTILFTEHLTKSRLNRPMKFPQKNVNITWDPEVSLELDDSQKKIWSIVINDPDLSRITNLDMKEGVLYFYEYVRLQAITIGRTLIGFEQTLVSMERWGDSLALESKSDVKKSLSIEDLEKYFKESLKVYEQNILYSQEIEKKKEWNKILASYLTSISSYKYKQYFEEIRHSMSQRNKAWCGILTQYLKKSEPDTSPLLIVVGAAHLNGGIEKGCQSFLEILMQTDSFESIKRMSITGEWIPL